MASFKCPLITGSSSDSDSSSGSDSEDESKSKERKLLKVRLVLVIQTHPTTLQEAKKILGDKAKNIGTPSLSRAESPSLLQDDAEAFDFDNEMRDKLSHMEGHRASEVDLGKLFMLIHSCSLSFHLGMQSEKVERVSDKCAAL